MKNLFLALWVGTLLSGCGGEEEKASKQDFDDLADRVERLENHLGIEPVESPRKTTRGRESHRKSSLHESKERIAANWVQGNGQALISRYVIRHGQLPEKIEDLLKDHPRHGAIAREKDLKDPWGNQYQYKRTGANKYELWTVTPAPDNVKISSSED